MISRLPRRLSILPRWRAGALAPVLLPLMLGLSVPVVRAEVTDVDRDALEALIDRGVPVIDVRREDEWRARGVIDGSHLLTFFDARGGYDADAWLDALAEIVAPDEPFVLVCAHGVRSKRIADLLDSRLGYAAVHDASGGIEGFRDAGGRVVPHVP